MVAFYLMEACESGGYTGMNYKELKDLDTMFCDLIIHVWKHRLALLTSIPYESL